MSLCPRAQRSDSGHRRRSRWSKIGPLIFVLAGLLQSARVHAQRGIPSTIQFSFANPGARSMGMGSAFVAIADDATAVYANPAGLVQLVKPEVSLETRGWDYSTPFVAGGRVEGEPTDILLDVAGRRNAESSVTLTGPSFLSFVYPASRWAVAAYLHQTAKFQSSAESQGFFSTDDSGELTREDFRVSTDLDLKNYGLSFAYRVTDHFSVGGGVSYFQQDFTHRGLTYFNSVPAEIVDPEANLPAWLFGQSNFPPETQTFSTELRAHDSSWGLNIGVFWQITSQWSLGGFVRQGPTFDMDFEFRSGPAYEPPEPDQPPIPSGTLLAPPIEDVPVPIPQVSGLGVAYKSRNEALTIALEWDHVRYSSIVAVLPTFELEDGNELHAGVEYVFLQSVPVVAIRGGMWIDPDHRIRDLSDDPLARFILQPRDDEIHWTGGLGFAFSRFQIDVGVDLSDLVKTASVSVIVNLN